MALLLAATMLALLAQALASPVSPAAPMVLPSPLTLGNAILIATRRQPLLFIAAAQSDQAEALKQEAKAAYYPAITPTYQYIQQNATFPRTQTAYNPVTGGYTYSSSSNSSSGQGGVTLQEDIFDNGLREALNGQARRNVDAAKDNADNVEQETILTVTQAYFNVLRASDLARVAQVQIRRAGQEVSLVQAEIDTGVAAKSAIFQPRADLANGQIALSQAQVAVNVGIAGLKNAMGIISNSPLILVPLSGAPVPETPNTPDDAANTDRSVPAPVGVPPSAIPAAAPDTGLEGLPHAPVVTPAKTIDEYFASAQRARPDLKQQIQLVEVQKLIVKQAQLNAGVAVNGTYSFTYFNSAGPQPQGTDSTVTLSASYPLFDGGLTRAGVRAAVAERDAAVDEYELMRQGVRSQIEEDAGNRAGSLDQIGLARASISAAQSSYDAAMAQLKLGLATVFDVTTTEVTLTQAQNVYVTALYSFYSYDAALQRDLGIDDVAPVSIPNAF